MSDLPHRLFRELAEGRSLLERMTHGILLSELKGKIKTWGKLSNKDCVRLVLFMRDRGFISTFAAVSSGPGQRKPDTFLIKSSYEDKARPPKGYELIRTGPGEPVTKEGSPVAETVSPPVITPVENTAPLSPPPSPPREDSKEEPETVIVKKPTTQTAEAMRRQAAELLKAAEEAERLSNQNDLFNKRLAPVRLEVLQAVASVQKQFDGMVDAMAVLETSIKKLRELSA